MTGATGALVSLGARGRHRFFLVLAMGKWNQLHTRNAALKHQGLKLQERKEALSNRIGRKRRQQRVLACSAGQVQLCAESVLETITETRKRKLDTDAGLHNVNCVGVSAVVRHESLRYRER